MTDKEQTELLTDVLKALFGPMMKGNYLVTIRGDRTIDADDKADAIKKAKDYYKEHIDELSFSAMKMDDIVDTIKERFPQ